ncbi:MAG TPA: CPBP family intramembrane metalloprotease [Parvularculaceae bacterium]|nr:CPBP family intramembrane metalloprotease [Parvularculaceae bacterium]
MAVADHIKGHFFAFDRKPNEIPSATAWKLLLLFVVFEYAIGPRMGGLAQFGLVLPEGLRVILLTAALLVLTRLFVGPLSQIGLRPWRDWNRIERSYFTQTFLLANAVFLFLRRSRLADIATDPGLIIAAGASFFAHLFWGFYQEAIYRGVLQTALVRRLGAVAGVILANIAFTFGPLHYYHFAESSNPLTMFGAIFAIGLLFGVIRRRSDNLIIVGVLHGVGDWYLTGL